MATDDISRTNVLTDVKGMSNTDWGVGFPSSPVVPT
jgi:hypothetical protein